MNVMLKLLIITGLVWCSSAFAMDEWFCTSESSQIQGNTIQACGIGVAQDEDSARKKAFENAQAEFQRLCDSSDTCAEREVRAEPKRTTCEKRGATVKCYRMVAYSLGKSKVSSQMPRSNYVSASSSGHSLSNDEFIYHPASSPDGNGVIKYSHKVGYIDNKGTNGFSLVTFMGHPGRTSLDELSRLAQFRAIELCNAKALPITFVNEINDQSTMQMFWGDYETFPRIEVKYKCNESISTIGVSLNEVSSKEITKFSKDRFGAVEVIANADGSPNSNLDLGDIIFRVNGRRTPNKQEVMKQLSKVGPDGVASVDVIASGKLKHTSMRWKDDSDSQVEVQNTFMQTMCKTEQVADRPVCKKYLSTNSRSIASNPETCFDKCDARKSVDLEKCYRRCR